MSTNARETLRTLESVSFVSRTPLIPLLTWDNPTHPTSRVSDIIITSWDQVYVYVEDRLT
jgi:hypothetical protein